eukprot:CAMPEP_0114545464 /NCGR_PEP_ID=MMETSP0114-20121206/3414_1 /TAXON_ID=31324 /ORGANISM="Goniomonas sp, Strain m" /LENGTH=100 /DNA_ID=CAMNT_0001729893 /DNA_START=35 /DNA_END=337 /DNA_ORIENTATION=+
MARGASQSGASQNVARGGSRGSAAPTGGRPSGGSSASSAGGRRPAPKSGATQSGGIAGLTRFYTNDGAGMKIGPTAVLVVSLCFIAFVVFLHIFGKFARK